MYFNLSDVADLLTEEERSLLVHKLRSARTQHRIVSNNCFALVDGLSEDWPWEDRIEYGSTPDKAIWYAAHIMNEAVMQTTSIAMQHDDACMDLLDITGYFG